MTSKDIHQIVDELLKRKLETIDYYFEEYPFLANEREKLHEDILQEIISKPCSRNRKVYMLGGAPANGKSSLLSSTYLKYQGNPLKIDPDEIKKRPPEYNFMVSLNEPSSAAVVHEESSVISKRIRQEATRLGLDLILDGVADDTLVKRKKAFEEFKSGNYFVRMDYVSLDTELSLQLAKQRGEETGREVPETFVKSMNKVIAELVPQLLENQIFDELYLWDTNNLGNPRLILRQINTNLEILYYQL